MEPQHPPPAPRHLTLGRQSERVFLLLHNGHYYCVLWAYDNLGEAFRASHPFLNFVVTDTEPPLFMWEHYRLAYPPEFAHLSTLVLTLDGSGSTTELLLDAAPLI